MTKKQTYKSITIPINKLASEVNSCLDKKEELKYLQNITLLYSFQENILKWLVFNKLLWDKAGQKDGSLDQAQMKAIGDYCKQLNLYQVQKLAYSISLIDWKLLNKLNAIRKNRNSMLHDLWLFEHRNNYKYSALNWKILQGLVMNLLAFSMI